MREKEVYLGEENLSGGKRCSKCHNYPKIRKWRDYAGVTKIQYLCNCDKLPVYYYYYFNSSHKFEDCIRLWNFVYAE